MGRSSASPRGPALCEGLLLTSQAVFLQTERQRSRVRGGRETGLGLVSSKNCRNAALLVTQCSGAATAATITSLPVTGSVTGFALGTSPAGK